MLLRSRRCSRRRRASIRRSSRAVNRAKGHSSTKNGTAATVGGVGSYVCSCATRAERSSSGSATMAVAEVAFTSSRALLARGAFFS